MIKKQEKTDQSPAACRKYFEDQGITASLDKVWGFVYEAVLRFGPYQPPSEENTKAAAVFLLEIIEAAKYGEPWDLYKERAGVKKRTVKRFDPEEVTGDQEAFGIVLAYIDKKINQPQAIELFRERIHPGSDSTIMRWIKAIEPRVRKAKELQDQIKKVLVVKPKV